MSNFLIPYEFGKKISEYYNSVPNLSYEISKCGNRLKQKSLQDESKTTDLDLDLVVTGGGILGIYFALSTAHLVNKSNIKFHRLSGVSIGAIFVTIIKCGIEEHTINKYLEEYHSLRRNWIDKDEIGERKGNKISINDDFSNFLREILPSNAWQLCSGSVFITMTELTLTGPKIVTISEYTDNDDLINAIVASASIPFLSIKGVYTLFRGRKMIDGINPYHFEDEIRPCLVANFAYVPYPLHKLLSMSDKKICKLAYDGFKNFLKWTENNHDSSCFYLQRRTLSKYIHYALNIVYWADAKIIEKLPIIGNLKKKIVKKLLV
jgi:hypothetical protein